MSLRSSDYLVVPQPVDNPRVRLVVFPHAGGGPSSFASWQEGLFKERRVEVVVISAPGRERRVAEAAHTSCEALVADVAKALQASGLVDDVPYAFFGHSLGSLVALETARFLDEQMVSGRPRPIHVFASGHGPPATAPAAGGKVRRGLSGWGRLHALDDAALMKAVAQFGVMPEALLADEGLASAVLPALRADFALYETYAPQASRAPIDVPISALGGSEDAGVSEDDLYAWGSETSCGLYGPEVFAGGHFFIEERRDEVLATVASHLQDTLGHLPLSVGSSSQAVPSVCESKNMDQVFLSVAARCPDAEAIVDASERVSYGELARRVRTLAAALQSEYLHGRAQQVVALLMPHDATYIASMLGIWQAAGILLVIEPHFPAAMVKEICEESGCVAAIASDAHRSKFDDVSGCKTLMLKGDWAATLEAPLDMPMPEVRAADLGILMMTSGTTGRPKTIAGTHYFLHLGARVKALVTPYADDDDREAFNVMFAWEAIRPLLYGLTSFVVPDEATLEPSLFVEHLERNECTRVLTTPSLLATILQHSGKDIGTRLAAMRTWFMCGEVLPMSTATMFQKALPNCKLVNDYSAWESGDIAYATVSPSPAYLPSQTFAPAGKIAPGSIAVIIDPETRKVVPRGVPGELYVGGSALMHGYYGKPEETAKRLVEGFMPEMHNLWSGKWYQSGDCGRFVGEPPVLEIRGRIDSTVKIRGFKVGIPVVESSILEVEGVGTCCCVPVYESPAVVDSLLCYVRPKDGVAFDGLVQLIRKEGGKKIPRWMMPAYFRPLPEGCTMGGESKKLNRRMLAQLADLATLREEQAQAAQRAADAADLGAPAEVEGGVRGIVRAVWAKALNLDVRSLDIEENFFDLGGHSQLAATIATRLSEEYGLAVSVLDIYSNSTLGALLDFVDAKGAESAAPAPGLESKLARRVRGGTGGAPSISVVGIAGKFPGAVDAEAFWHNLKTGTVSATFLLEELMRSKGLGDDLINHKDFVPCAYMIQDVDKFDHQFFGIGRHEASLMDPQHRVFLETTYAALENAALAPKGGLGDTVVGVFAAAGIDGYLVHHLDGLPLKNALDPQDVFLAEIGNEKDYIATRVSYLLDFTGPSMNVNSACSSALVAAVQAAAAIAAGQCDAAVAGASSVTFPNLGYLYQDGLVASVDGYVRPFDAGADGTVFGDAVASLILRRTDEVADGLSWGSMRGFAVTNDGGQKAGYAAPSPVGQSNAVTAALKMMGEDPWSISYVEAHATGTRVGDGIEIRGLRDAFSRAGGKAPEGTQVALGSVKGNIAHANCAAGATGFIKTLMMLHHRQLVPVANFQKLNPKIDLGDTPFFINNELCSWETQAKPLRAGVSSFGIGGTNAHVVLEALPAPLQAVAEKAAPRVPFHIVPLSAKTPSALKNSAERLKASLRRPSEGEPSMASVAFTLQTGRSMLPLRKAVVVPSADAMEPGMQNLSVVANVFEKRFPDEEDLEELDEAAKKPTVALVFPGQGSQHLGMALGLYEQVPLYRDAVDRCCELLKEPTRLGFDLRPLVFVRGGDLQEREREFSRPTVLQPSLFVVEYALSQVLLACGVKPVAVAGHSLGEYVAAVTGGLLTLEAAVGIVSARAQATETLAKDGAMLSVSEWSESELEAIANGERKGLWLAAVNSQLHAVISGEADAVSELEAELKAAGRKCAKLHVRKAFHSGLVADAANTLEGLGVPAEGVDATLPVASNLTGGWMSAAQLRDGKYWTGHMRGTVYWRQNAEKLLSQWQPTAVLEAGPGNTLSALTSKCIPKDGKAPAFVQAMRHPKSENVHDVEALLGGLGRLWELGFAIDWHALHTTVFGQGRVPGLLRMPTYAFDKISLWERPERSVYVEGSAPKDDRSASHASAVAPAPKSLIRFGKRSGGEPAIRAYCLPFASGSATIFSPWAEQADIAVEIVAVELPGRGGRSDERIPSDDAQDDSLLSGLCEAILADLRGAQYVLVGFSMGGGMAVELAMRLAEKQAPLPLALYVAGRKPPSSDPALVGDITMSNEELAEYAFAPPEVARSQEFAEHVVPLLRADLGMDARCERRLSALSLAGRTLPAGLGLEILCGVTDGVAPFTEAPGWQRFLSAPLGLHYFPGGHEFMQDQRERIIAQWRRDAIGRLVQRRSAEVALLSAQAFSAPTAVPAPLAALTGAAAPVSESGVDATFPFYAVRWVEATSLLSSGAALHRFPSAYVVNLSSELSDGVLTGAVNAAQGGIWIAIVCAASDGVLGSQDGVDLEVRQCWKYMRVMQKLIEVGATAHILVVCPAAASGAMVAGASKAVAMEEAALQVQRIFLTPARLADATEKMKELVVLAAHHQRESDLWIQDDSLSGAVFTQRIEPMTAPSSKMPCVPKVSADGKEAAYVLTGATGGLGKAVVEWMLRDQGLAPHQLVLLRRSGSAPLAGSLAKCRVVEVSCLDGQEELVGSALAHVQNVLGVFHLAGVLDDGILGGMTEDRVRKVAQPKCGGLASLMHAAKALRWPLKWILGFSSTSSLFGYAGQSNYCAANAMIDQLASFGAAGALPSGDRPPCRVLAVNWGPWGEAGMAKVGTKAYQQAVEEGDTPLPTSVALRCLAAALRTASQAQPAATQFCACNVEWQKSQWSELPILRLVHEAPESDSKGNASDTGSENGAVASTPVARAEAFLVEHTKSGRSWSRVQGKSLHQLGLDSLEVVQIRNLFNKKFSVNVPLGVVADPSALLSDLAESLAKFL